MPGMNGPMGASLHRGTSTALLPLVCLFTFSTLLQFGNTIKYATHSQIPFYHKKAGAKSHPRKQILSSANLRAVSGAQLEGHRVVIPAVTLSQQLSSYLQTGLGDRGDALLIQQPQHLKATGPVVTIGTAELVVYCHLP